MGRASHKSIHLGLRFLLLVTVLLAGRGQRAQAVAAGETRNAVEFDDPLSGEPSKVKGSPAVRPGLGLPSLSATPEVIDNEESDDSNSGYYYNVTLRWTGAQPEDLIGIYYYQHAPRGTSLDPARGDLVEESGDRFQLTGPYGVFQTRHRVGESETNAIVNARVPVRFQLIHPAESSSRSRYSCKDTGELDCTSESDFDLVDRAHRGIVIAVSKVVRFKNPNAPHHVHLSLGQEPDEMRVMWTSKEVGEKPPQVRVGTEAGNWNVGTFEGTSYTYRRDTLCGHPATNSGNFFEPGIFDDVLIRGLVASTHYYYQVHNGGTTSKWSRTHEFVSAPSHTSSETVEGVVFGDLGLHVPFTTTFLSRWANFGNYGPAKLTMDFIRNRLRSARDRPLHILHIGDISYSRGFSLLWEYFMSQISAVATHAPYMVGIGNHEYDWKGQPFQPTWAKFGHDSGGECGVPYFKRFHMPGASNDSVRNLYYSFDWGPLHYVIMSTEHDFREGSEQYEWIEKDLSLVDRDKTPFIIFGGHRPMYTSSNVHGIEEYMQECLEPLFQRYYVDLALWGHIHMYERTHPLFYNGTRSSSGEHGTIHVVIGNAGHEFQVPWKPRNIEKEEDRPVWVASRSHEFGIGSIRASTSKLRFTSFLGPDTDEVLDEFSIYSSDQVFRKEYHL
eukprot:gb/GECG01007064.1/.p1 GENE.gb/GECG01007064.1/~~gb/GECG01007064.1/.p1  ORF type:complete len:670 (+),score=40.47 gb/GECG01007064.1/:1-2010(+)